MGRYWRTTLAVIWGAMATLVFWHNGHLWFQGETPLHTALDVVGSMLIATGGLLRMWSSVYIRPHKGKTLMTAGPYGHCRHPLYLGSLLLLIGVCMVAQHTLFVLGSIAIWLPAYIVKIRFEESNLEKRFGQEWRDYCTRTPRLLFHLTNWRQGSAESNMSVLWRNSLVEMPGILAFVGLAIVLEYFENIF